MTGRQPRPADMPRQRGPHTSPVGMGIADGRGPHPTPPPPPQAAGWDPDPARPARPPRAAERTPRAALLADVRDLLLAAAAFLGVVAALGIALAWIGGAL